MKPTFQILALLALALVFTTGCAQRERATSTYSSSTGTTTGYSK